MVIQRVIHSCQFLGRCFTLLEQSMRVTRTHAPRTQTHVQLLRNMRWQPNPFQAMIDRCISLWIDHNPVELKLGFHSEASCHVSLHHAQLLRCHFSLMCPVLQVCFFNGSRDANLRRDLLIRQCSVDDSAADPPSKRAPWLTFQFSFFSLSTNPGPWLFCPLLILWDWVDHPDLLTSGCAGMCLNSKASLVSLNSESNFVYSFADICACLM